MIDKYIKNKRYRKALDLPENVVEEYKPFAQGEYNINYAFNHPKIGKKLVLRVNCGSQMHLTHQIEYEAHALRLLETSGRTPQLLYVDGSEDTPKNGVLVEEYIEGSSLDYTNREHMRGAAQCLADIHAVQVRESEIISGMPGHIDVCPTRLIAPERSLAAILDECEMMVKTYMDSDLGSTETKTRLRELLDNAWILAKRYDCDSPYKCCINTELNSTNFIVGEYVSLVDWEKPLYGDPAQDIGHFLAPTTTFWKTDVIFDNIEIETFIQDYISAVNARFDTTGLKERILAFIPVTCLRGMTWCAMAWVEYQQEDKQLTNESTRNKLEQYLSDPYITRIESVVNNAM